MARTTPQHENLPAVPGPVRASGSVLPDRLYVLAPGYKRNQTRLLANQSAALARALSPKLSGRGAQGIKPYYGDGFFGVKWDRSYIWYQEAGINPFTMLRLAGKTIPMWIDDPTGAEQRANPKAKTRVTVNGRRQVLIFRKAAKPGERKRVAVRDRSGRLRYWRDVPKSYPGAPGRISHRGFDEVRSSTTGRIAKLVSRPHVGVRWRHPGIVGREFMQYAIQETARLARLPNLTVYATYRRR